MLPNRRAVKKANKNTARPTLKRLRTAFKSYDLLLIGKPLLPPNQRKLAWDIHRVCLMAHFGTTSFQAS
jgi:hypothetical protein